MVFHILPCQVRLPILLNALESDGHFTERTAPNSWYVTVPLLRTSTDRFVQGLRHPWEGHAHVHHEEGATHH